MANTNKLKVTKVELGVTSSPPTQPCAYVSFELLPDGANNFFECVGQITIKLSDLVPAGAAPLKIPGNTFLATFTLI